MADELTEEVVEQCGEFKVRYGYNSSMDLSNIIGVLEANGVPAQEVGKVISKMAKAKVPAKKLANYLADYYKLFGW